MLKLKLADVELVIDKGNASEEVIYKRLAIVNSINELEKQQAMETTQKAKIKWAIKGDENSKYYHGILNKNLNNLAIRGVLESRKWIENLDLRMDMEADVTIEEFKNAVWDCGTDKSPGPNEFSFDFYRRFWSVIQKNVVAANVVDVGMFKDTIIYALKCFERASGLRMNMSKSKIMGIAVNGDKVDQVAYRIGCGILEVPFTYLGAMPIYHMSIFKVKWNNVLVLKEKDRLGVSSLYALNRALLFKWVWRFITQKNSLWARVISAIHGMDGKIGTRTKSGYNSLWRDFVFEMEAVKDKGADLFSFLQKRLGDGVDTCFWKDTWNGELPFKFTYPRLYALEVDKNISVADKLTQATWDGTFRREPRSGIEAVQLVKLEDKLEDVQLVNKRDRWAWSLNGSGEFSVASIRRLLDDIRLPEVSSQTRWIKEVPIKVNILAWNVILNGLPSHVNISHRDNFKKVCRWWNVDFAEVSSYDEWLLWISSLRIHGKHKKVLEGVCYGLWWHLWFFQNKWMFMERLFHDVVLHTFYWIRYHCKVVKIKVVGCRSCGVGGVCGLQGVE
nr:RNA-directed DNA polymerase, eukaryota, reverse transcriptase zinc-binding domain protein [Tanacetum cinerariifolium]